MATTLPSGKVEVVDQDGLFAGSHDIAFSLTESSVEEVANAVSQVLTTQQPNTPGELAPVWVLLIVVLTHTIRDYITRAVASFTRRGKDSTPPANDVR
jgi:hypothetical protein